MDTETVGTDLNIYEDLIISSLSVFADWRGFGCMCSGVNLFS